METQMSRGGVLASLVLTLSMLLAPGSTSEQDLPAKVPQSGKTVAEKQLRMMGHVLARIEGLAYRINLLGGQRYARLPRDLCSLQIGHVSRVHKNGVIPKE